MPASMTISLHSGLSPAMLPSAHIAWRRYNDEIIITVCTLYYSNGIKISIFKEILKMKMTVPAL